MAPPRIPDKLPGDPVQNYGDIPVELQLTVAEAGSDCYKPPKPCVKGEVCKEYPPELNSINILLCQRFAGQKHYLQIERFGDKFFYVLRFRNELSAKTPIRLIEFDPNNLNDTGDFIAFDVSNKIVRLSDDKNMRIMTLEDDKSESTGSVRYMVIPVNSRESYMGSQGLVRADLGRILFALSGEKGVRIDAVSTVRNADLDKTGIYQVELWTPSQYDQTKLGEAVVVTRKDDEFISLESGRVTGRRALEKPDVEAFVKKVVFGAEQQSESKEGLNGETVDIIFAIDHSGGMESAAALVVRGIGKIISQLKEKGVKKVRIGLVAFNANSGVKVLLPLTSMNESGIAEFFDKMGAMQFEGNKIVMKRYGIVLSGDKPPVGDAALKAIDLLPSKGDVRQVVLMTDRDSVKDKSKLPLAMKTSQDRSVNLMIQEIDGGDIIELSGLAAVQKLVVLGKIDEVRRIMENPTHKTKDGWTNFEAVYHLATLGDPKAIDIMRRAAFGEFDTKLEGTPLHVDLFNFDAQLEALSVLWALKDYGTIRKAAKVLRDRPGIMANDFVAHLGEKDGILGLAAIAKSSTDAWIALDRLKYRWDFAKGVLETAVVEEPDEMKRLDLAQVLYRLGEKETALKAIKNVCENSNDEDTSITACRLLKKLK